MSCFLFLHVFKKKQLNVDKATEDGIVPSFPPPNQETQVFSNLFAISLSFVGLLFGVCAFCGLFCILILCHFFRGRLVTLPLSQGHKKPFPAISDWPVT